jgi:hypothetical protein
LGRNTVKEQLRAAMKSPAKRASSNKLDSEIENLYT